MSASDDHEKIEFQHDTDNLTVFTIVLFCTTGVMFVIACTLVVFRIGKDDEIRKKVYENPSTRYEKMREYEDIRLSGNGTGDEFKSGDKEGSPSVTHSWNRNIEDGMNTVIEEYSR